MCRLLITHTHTRVAIQHCCHTSVSGLALVTRRVLVLHSAQILTATRCLHVCVRVRVCLCVCSVLEHVCKHLKCAFNEQLPFKVDRQAGRQARHSCLTLHFRPSRHATAPPLASSPPGTPHIHHVAYL